MHIPTSIATTTLASSFPAPTLTGPGTCFVCGSHSDTLLIIQSFTLIILSIPLILISLNKLPSTNLFITILCITYMALILHATLKFFLNPWATSHDRPNDWRSLMVYGVTKVFNILGILQIWLGLWGAMWVAKRWRFGAYKEVEGDGGGGDDERPLMSEERGEVRDDGTGGDEGRFKVLLKREWRDGDGTSGNAVS